jgi:1-acyl-sn-glycerol-3-phosphate acyltransferase
MAEGPAVSGRGEQDVWWLLGRAVIGPVFHSVFRLRVAGAANVPSTGAGVIAANHVSVLDPLAVAMAVSRLGRTVHYLALTEVFDQRVVGFVLRKSRQIPLRRGAGDWGAVEEAAAVIRQGYLAGVSAEGRVGDGTAIQPIQKGTARIALAAGVPVIPTGVWGTHERWPQAGPRFSPPIRPVVAVAFGPPIPVEGDPRSRQDVRALTDRIAEGIGASVGSARALARRSRSGGTSYRKG